MQNIAHALTRSDYPRVRLDSCLHAFGIVRWAWLVTCNSPPAPNSPPARYRKQPRARPKNWSKASKFPPTEEQNHAIDLFIKGETMKISAFAGAGKTSTLKLLSATAPSERGLYLAFNKAISEEAKSTFSSRTDCRTTHSAALQYIRPRYGFTQAKLFENLTSRRLASAWNLEQIQVGPTVLKPDMLSFLILTSVRRFMQSGDPALNASHVRLLGKALGLSPNQKEQLIDLVYDGAIKLWQSMINETSEIPLGHDGYLKLWSLSEPKLDYDFILLDEAQDTNPAVLEVMKAQDTQLIYVGDRHQQIYEWRGATNAMEQIRNAQEAKLTLSFRFGPTLAEEAGRVLEAMGESHPLRGNPSKETKVVPYGGARTVLTRTNAMLFQEVMGALDNSLKAYVVGGTAEMKTMLRDVDSLQSGQPGTHPDFFGFYNWREVEDFVKEPEGEHLLSFVNLINTMGRNALWAAVLSVIDQENEADIILSTAHKAKGREWSSVRIGDDFSSVSSETGRIPYSEARLFYVAMTRATEQLVVDPALVAAFTSNLATDEELAQLANHKDAKPSLEKLRSGPSSYWKAPEQDAVGAGKDELRNAANELLEIARKSQTRYKPKKKGFLGLFK